MKTGVHLPAGTMKAGKGIAVVIARKMITDPSAVSEAIMTMRVMITAAAVMEAAETMRTVASLA
jgi:hypothetical protein